MRVDERLKELGIEVPQAAKPVAAYVPAAKVGKWVYISGQMPFRQGKLQVTGKAGSDVSLEVAYEEAKQCAINILAAIKTVAELDDVERVVKVTGFVASAAGFNDQPKVVNGASELFGKVFGDAGLHARAAIGVAELPMNTCVEVEAIVLLK